MTIKGKGLIGIFTVILLFMLVLFGRLHQKEGELPLHPAEKAESEVEEAKENEQETVVQKGKAETTEKAIEEETGPQISAESGFYDEDIEITVTAGRGGAVYYTSDGSIPASKEIGSTHRYKEPIVLRAGGEETVNVYRFKEVNGRAESEIVTHTYFMGKNIRERYDTLVLSLSAENDDLYGYENGIFVEGKLRDDWLQAHPGEETQYDTPANYNVRGKESERNIYIEMFEPDGSRVIAQNGGIRISGNFTRQSEQKSFKLYAREEYDVQNKFRYPFFEDIKAVYGDSVIPKYKSLKIRNTGNDRSEGFIRDELGLTLAAQAEFQDTQSVRPVSVYINGVYQGLYWMHSAYDSDYFEEKYGTAAGEMVVIESSETNMNTETEDESVNRYAAEYNELYARYSTADLTDEGIFRELDSYIDVKNYLEYYAIEIYLANRDWPFNNLQAYRYVAEEEEYLENSVFDGRYRYLLYDVDTSMGLGAVRETLNPNQSFETLVMIEERNYAPLFTALMQREDCRKYFASYVCDLLNGAFSTENVSETLDGLHQLRKNEMSEYIEESVRNPELPEIGEPYLEMQMDCIRAWAETAPDSMLTGMQQKWQLGEVYHLYVSVPEGDGVQINNVTVTETEFSGRYLTGCDTVLIPVVSLGEKFAYWEINGEIYTDEHVMVSQDMLTDGAVYASLYTTEYYTGLELQEIRAKGEEDYMVLTNTSEEVMSTWGYYLMDKEDASHMNYLEVAILEPGESVLIGGKNYDGSDSLMNTNFNIKKGKEVILGRSGVGIIERVSIPDMGMENGVYRKNLVTGKWQEEKGT